MNQSKDEMVWLVAWGPWTDVKKVIKNIKKFAEEGFYVDVTELGPEELKRIKSRMMIAHTSGIKAQNWFTRKNPTAKDLCLIRVWGPRGPIRHPRMVKTQLKKAVFVEEESAW